MMVKKSAQICVAISVVTLAKKNSSGPQTPQNRTTSVIVPSTRASRQPPIVGTTYSERRMQRERMYRSDMPWQQLQPVELQRRNSDESSHASRYSGGSADMNVTTRGSPKASESKGGKTQKGDTTRLPSPAGSSSGAFAGFEDGTGGTGLMNDENDIGAAHQGRSQAEIMSPLEYVSLASLAKAETDSDEAPENNNADVNENTSRNPADVSRNPANVSRNLTITAKNTNADGKRRAMVSDPGTPRFTASNLNAAGSSQDHAVSRPMSLPDPVGIELNTDDTKSTNVNDRRRWDALKERNTNIKERLQRTAMVSTNTKERMPRQYANEFWGQSARLSREETGGEDKEEIEGHGAPAPRTVHFADSKHFQDLPNGSNQVSNQHDASLYPLFQEESFRRDSPFHRGSSPFHRGSSPFHRGSSPQETEKKSILSRKEETEKVPTAEDVIKAIASSSIGRLALNTEDGEVPEFIHECLLPPQLLKAQHDFENERKKKQAEKKWKAQCEKEEMRLRQNETEEQRNHRIEVRKRYEACRENGGTWNEALSPIKRSQSWKKEEPPISFLWAALACF